MVLVRGVVGGVNNQSLEQEVEKWWCDVQLGKHLKTRKAGKQQNLSALRAAEQMGCQWKIPLTSSASPGKCETFKHHAINYLPTGCGFRILSINSNQMYFD